MKCSSRSLTIILALCVMGATSSCGGGNNHVPVYPVRGKVLFNGKPMAGGGSITFVPTEKQEGKAAGGIILDNGSYVLSTHENGDGSMVGTFRVLITQTVVQEPKSVPDGSGATPQPEFVVPDADRIPANYADLTASPLSAKVEAKQNKIDFELKSP